MSSWVAEEADDEEAVAAVAAGDLVGDVWNTHALLTMDARNS